MKEETQAMPPLRGHADDKAELKNKFKEEKSALREKLCCSARFSFAFALFNC